MKLHLDDVVDFITSNELSFVEGLVRLTGHEIDFKETNRTSTMIRQGAFPHRKEVKDFDFDFQPSVNQQQILDFETLRFVEKCENIVFLGPSGVGKSHLATAIGIAAAKKRQQAYFIKCHELLQQLKRANMENRLPDRLKHYSKYKVLVIDELGYLPIDKEDSKLFFQLIDMRYEKKSTIVTTNINFSQWDEVFYDPIVANAILDRILHHAHVVTINGRSYRMKNHIKPLEEEM
jgi:DNA replication protein DnaC